MAMKNLSLLFIVFCVATLYPYHSTSAQDNGTALLPGNLVPITIDNVNQLELLATLGRGVPIDAQWSPDGKWLAVLTSTAVWLYPENDLVSPPRPIANKHGTINCFTFHPDSKQVATGHPDGSIVVWDIETNTEQGMWETNQVEIRQLQYSPDSRHLVSTHRKWSRDESKLSVIILWNLASHEPILSVQEDVTDARSVAFSPDSQILVTNFSFISEGNSQSSLQFWDTTTGDLLREETMVPALGSLNFSPNGNLFFASGLEGDLIVMWNLQTSEQPEFFEIDAFIVGFSPEGNPLIVERQPVGSESTVEYVLRELTVEHVLFRIGLDAPVSKFALHPALFKLAIVAYGGFIYYYSDLGNTENLSLTHHFDGTIFDFAIRDDASIIATIESGNMVRLKTMTDSPGSDIMRLHMATTLAFSPDGLRLAVGDSNGMILLREISQNATTIVWQTGFDRITCLAFNSDDTLLAVGGYGGGIELWNITSLPSVILQKEEPTYEVVTAMTFSPVNDSLAIGTEGFFVWHGETIYIGYDPTQQIFASHTGNVFPQPRQNYTGEGSFYAIDFSSTGQYVIAGGEYIEDGFRGETGVYVMDVETGDYAVLRGHDLAILGIDISPNDNLIASASADGTVRLWSLEQRELLRILPMDGGANDVEFSADGRLLAVAGADGTVRLWGVPDGE